MRRVISKSGGNASLGSMINRTGQGVYREVGSEGLATKALSSTHRIKVFADGTVRKIDV